MTRALDGHFVKSAEARAYAAQVGMLIRPLCKTPLSCPVAVTVYLYRKRKSGDIDNPLKCLYDVCTGIVWNDDKQIIEQHTYLRDDKLNPRCEVIITTLEA